MTPVIQADTGLPCYRILAHKLESSGAGEATERQTVTEAFTPFWLRGWFGLYE